MKPVSTEQAFLKTSSGLEFHLNILSNCFGKGLLPLRRTNFLETSAFIQCKQMVAHAKYLPTKKSITHHFRRYLHI